MSHSAKIQSHHPAGSRTHGAGVLREEEHDPYRSAGKAPDGSTCPTCHASVRQGRWRWVSAPDLVAVQAAPAQPLPCPACRRIAADDPAGILTLSGTYAQNHRAELLALLRQVATRESAEHPLERIMRVEESPPAPTKPEAAPAVMVVTTTGLHLARALGHALERSHKGDLRQHYSPGEQRVRVGWARD